MAQGRANDGKSKKSARGTAKVGRRPEGKPRSEGKPKPKGKPRPSTKTKPKSASRLNAKPKPKPKRKLGPTQKPQQKQGGKSVKAPCPHAGTCGACPLIGVSYKEQLASKHKQLVDLFNDLAGKQTRIYPILGMDEPFHYRNKVISPYAAGHVIKTTDSKGKERKRREILTGMYASGTHEVVNTDGCLVENAIANHIVVAVRQLAPKFRIEPYDEDSGAGFLRHAVIRVGHASGEVLVTLVTNGRKFPGSRNFCRELIKRCPEITTVVQNVNTRDTNVILGDEGEQALYGPGFILDRLCGLSFRISSHSFYQVNAVQTEVLYRRAIELAEFTGAETALDAYCGTGTIGLVAACGLPGAPDAHAACVLGVDKVSEAIADARANASHNGVENARFVAQDAGQFMRELAREHEKLDVLFLDPPRAGASEEFLRATCTLGPKRIVYISCNPQTQARDVKYWVRHGYAATALQGVDMFPHTAHIESICVLERR